MIERNLPILATRKATAVRVDAFRAVPLTLDITIPDEIGSLAGATILRAEIRSSRVDLSATALAGSSITAPSGQFFELTFTSAQMNQSLGGEESKQFWLVVYATYPPGAVTGSTELELDVFASIDLMLHEHAASLTAPSPPNAAIALTKTQADLLYMPIGGGTPGTGTVTSVAVNTANGVSAVVTNPSSNVAMTFSLGAITPSSVNASGSISGSNLSTTGNVTGTWAGGIIPLTKGGTGATTAADARTALQLGTMALQNTTSYLASDWVGSANITTVGTITSGTWSAGTIALAKGGTGATTASGARSALELGGFAILNPTAPGPIGAVTPSTVKATYFESTTGTNLFGNVNWSATATWNFLGDSKANILSALTLGPFDDVTHKGVILTGVLTITSSGSTPVFTYAAGAAAIHRAALGLGTAAQSAASDFLATDWTGNANIATVGTVTSGTWSAGTIALAKGGTGATTASGARAALGLGALSTIIPTGTADATTYLRGDGAWATVTTSGGFVGAANRVIVGGIGTNADSNFEATLIIAAPNATDNVARLAAVGTATNMPVCITPKGTGAFMIGPAPDSAATGGNARGIGAVDLQAFRKTAAQIGSGPYSLTHGGYDAGNASNTNAGWHGVVIGGFANSITANSSSSLCNSVVGGTTNQISSSSSYNFIGGGNSANISSTSNNCAIAGGTGNNTTTATRAFLGGGYYNQISSSDSAIIGGSYGLCDRYGMQAFGAGQYGDYAYGKKQRANFTLSCITSLSTSAVEMALDGSTSYLTIPSGKTMGFTAHITGTKVGGTLPGDVDACYFIRKGIIRNQNGTTTIVGSIVNETIYGGILGTNTCLVDKVDATTDYLSIKVATPGTASETWRWVAHVQAIEINHVA